MVEVILAMVNSRGVSVIDDAEIKLPMLPVIDHRLSYKGFTGRVKTIDWNVVGQLDTIITVTVLVY